MMANVRGTLLADAGLRGRENDISRLPYLVQPVHGLGSLPPVSYIVCQKE